MAKEIKSAFELISETQPKFLETIKLSQRNVLKEIRGIVEEVVEELEVEEDFEKEVVEEEVPKKKGFFGFQNK